MKSTQKKKILVLGGTGFIGKNICSKLRNKNNIVIFSRKKNGDLRKFLVLKNFLEKNCKIDIIINCAAHVGGLNYILKKSADIVSDNLQIYNNLYKSLINLKKKPIIVNLLSNCLYPEGLKIQVEEKWQDGKMHDSVEAFGISKRVLIILSKNYQTQYGINTQNIILPNVFGPGDHLDPHRSHALNAIIVRMLKSQKNNLENFEVWGTGKPKREWIFVEDVSRIIEEIITKKINNFFLLNVAQNKSYSINKIADIIKNTLHYNCKIVNNKKYLDGAPLKQLSEKNFKKYFKSFKFTNFNIAIKKTIKSYL
jgi:GDP-L-fucose synthase